MGKSILNGEIEQEQEGEKKATRIPKARRDTWKTQLEVENEEFISYHRQLEE